MRTIEEILKEGNCRNLVDLLTRAKLDFKFFCEAILGLTEDGGIHEYQLDWFYAFQNNTRTVIRAPSGFSKTTMVVAYSLWTVFNYPKTTILLISKTVVQSKDALLMQIKGYIEDNELLKELVPKDREATWNQTQITMSNGSKVLNRPYAQSIKGYRADIIILDEADSYENTDIYFDYVISRINPGGRIILISTPEDGTSLLGLIEAKDKGNYKIIDTPAIIEYTNGDLSTGKSIWPERFPMPYLMQIRDEQGEQFFQKNYMVNIRTEAEDSVFTLSSILESYDDSVAFCPPQGGEVYMGLDFAISKGPKADFDAYVVVEKKDNFYFIRHIEIHKGVPTPVKATRIQHLIDRFNPVRIVADVSNIGVDVIDELRARAVPVIEQKFHPEARKKLLVNLKTVLENKKLIIPRSKDDLNAIKLTNELQDQLLGFREKKSEKTGHKHFHSGHTHDDIVMALAMAIQEAIFMREITVIGKTRMIQHQSEGLNTSSSFPNYGQEGSSFIRESRFG